MKRKTFQKRKEISALELKEESLNLFTWEKSFLFPVEHKIKHKKTGRVYQLSLRYLPFLTRGIADKRLNEVEMKLISERFILN